MKAMFSLLLGFILVLVTGCGQVVSQTTDAPPAAASLAVSVQAVSDPSSCAAWMQSVLVYESNTTSFQDPNTIFLKGHGDCEDYAVLAEYALLRKGYTVQVLTVYTATTAHALCAWYENGYWHYLSSTGMRTYAGQSLAEVAACIYPDWIAYRLYPEDTAVARSSITKVQ